jgi:hypothetical protein
MRHITNNRLGSLAVTALAVCLVLVGLGSAASAASPRLGAGFVAITNFQTSKCLEPASTAEFAPIVEANCAPDGTVESILQGWQANSFGGTNHYQFKNQRTGFCFNAFDGAFNGGRVLATTCASISNEQWNTARMVPSNVAVKIESRERFRDTTICIDVAPDGTNTVLFQCNGTQMQAWFVR